MPCARSSSSINGGFQVDAPVGLVKAIAAYMVFGGVELGLANIGRPLSGDSACECQGGTEGGLIHALTKAEVPRLRRLRSKPQWTSLSLLAFLALSWGGRVGEHEYMSTYCQKGKITEGDLDGLMLATDVDAADSAA